MILWTLELDNVPELSVQTLEHSNFVCVTLFDLETSLKWQQHDFNVRNVVRHYVDDGDVVSRMTLIVR